eukprot:COSAG06_NODE_7006_length_2679_cov_5.460465_1_plen_112_part_00
MTSTAVGGAQPVSWRASGAALRVVLCHAPLFPTSCQQHAGLVASQWPICQDKLRTGSERGQKLDGAKIDSRERESPAAQDEGGVRVETRFVARPWKAMAALRQQHRGARSL